MEKCEVCEAEIEEGTGDKYVDNSCGYVFWLCDKCDEIRDSLEP